MIGIIKYPIIKDWLQLNKCPAAITLRAPNGVLVPIIWCSLKLRKLIFHQRR